MASGPGSKPTAWKAASHGVARSSPLFRLTRAEERRLVARARSGDPKAIRRLIDLVSGPVFRFGRGFCGNVPDAEDVAQVVLVTLLRKLGDLRGDAALTTWTYVVARNACRRRRRRERGAGVRLESLEGARSGRAAFQIADASADPSRAAERRELGGILERAIAALPAAHREALILRDVEGLRARAAAEVLGVDVAALKSRLHRARLALRAALEPYVRTGPPLAPRAGSRTPDGTRCPDTPRMISRYLEGEISPAVCARLERHVSECSACGAACEALRTALVHCRAWRDEPVPAEVGEKVRQALRVLIVEDRRG
jgi:RNA polymerase sigma-70 factor (ECF subfamily)